MRPPAQPTARCCPSGEMHAMRAFAFTEHRADSCRFFAFQTKMLELSHTVTKRWGLLGWKQHPYRSAVWQ